MKNSNNTISCLMSNKPISNFTYTTTNYIYYYYVSKGIIRISEPSTGFNKYYPLFSNNNIYYIPEIVCTKDFCYCKYINEENNSNISNLKYQPIIPSELYPNVIEGFKELRKCLNIERQLQRKQFNKYPFIVNNMN